jgi:hypothetical protein
MSENLQIDQPGIDNSIHSLSALPMPGNRVRAVIDLADNHSKPNLKLVLTDTAENEVSRSIILGAIGKHVEFTLHVRVADPLPPLTLTCITYMEDDQAIDTKTVETTLVP